MLDFSRFVIFLSGVSKSIPAAGIFESLVVNRISATRARGGSRIDLEGTSGSATGNRERVLA